MREESGREKTKCKGPEVESVYREQEGRIHCCWSGVSKRKNGEREGQKIRGGQIVYRPCSP